MLLTIDRIESYTAGMTFEAFCADPKTIDAVIRNLEVMGEAARHMDDETARAAPGVPWPDVRDMRNILIHEYLGVDLDAVWKTILRDLPVLKSNLRRLLVDLGP